MACIYQLLNRSYEIIDLLVDTGATITVISDAVLMDVKR